MQDELVQVQPKFKSNLLESVEVFREDVNNFTEAYETVNYMWDTACSSVCGVGFCGIKRNASQKQADCMLMTQYLPVPLKGVAIPLSMLQRKHAESTVKIRSDLEG